MSHESKVQAEARREAFEEAARYVTAGHWHKGQNAESFAARTAAHLRVLAAEEQAS